MEEPSRAPETLAERAGLEPLVKRFETWYRSLSSEEQNDAFSMTTGLASTMAREQNRYSPHSGPDARADKLHERAFGAYSEYASRLEPPFTPRELAVVSYLIFVEPFHDPRTFTSDAQRGSDVNNP